MKEHTLVVYDRGKYYYLTYKVIDGRLRQGEMLRTGAGRVYYMPHGINAKAEAGWCSETNALLFCNGDPFYGIRYSSKVTAEGQEGVCSIGDVNNDGIGDVAVIYNPIDDQYHLTIYLGGDFTSSVNEQDSLLPSLSIDGRQPISEGGPIEVSMVFPRAATFTINLYSLRGELLSTLLSEHFDAGTYKRSLTLPTLPAGMYNIRLSGGGNSIDKGILITR
jgi:hypothetical protein